MERPALKWLSEISQLVAAIFKRVVEYCAALHFGVHELY